MIDLFAANNSTSEELFSEYVNLLFTNLSRDVNLEEFLRFFSSNFFLNGQSQQILRVLDKITVLFFNHQPMNGKILKTSDATYTFANAIILLNSDLHNPQNEEKMSLQSFYKMCKRINAGEDLSAEILTNTYTNIKKNKINTFRQKSQMFGISPSNFVLICNKEEEYKMDFYDLEMRMLTDENFYNFWVYDLLTGIIDERETMKLEQLIQRFIYEDNSYQCEVIQLIRKLSIKKPHTPLHALEKILQHANFKNSKTSQKTISYLWLAVNLIETFPSYLLTNVICQLLIFTWRMRSEIRDDMYLRQKAEIKRVRKMIKQYQKRQGKKSIMDMFSSFLASKDDDSQPEAIEEFNMTQTSIKKMNHKILTQKVVDVLIKSSFGNQHSKINHRMKAIEFFIGYLKNDEQKLFEEFLSLLYLIFHLLYRYNTEMGSQQINSEAESPTQIRPSSISSPHKNSTSLNSSLQLSTEMKSKEDDSSRSQFEEVIEDLFYQLLGLKQSSITKRIENLKKKDIRKYQILESYSHFWVLKILISKIQVKSHLLTNQFQNQSENNHLKQQTKQKNRLYLLNKSIDYIQKTDKEILMDLMYEFEAKAKQVFSTTFKSSSEIQSPKKIPSSNEIKTQLLEKSQKQDLAQKNLKQTLSELQGTTINTNLQKSKQLEFQQIHGEPKINMEKIDSTKQEVEKRIDQDNEVLIEGFIFNYRKIIQEFYVNAIRLIGLDEMKKNKQWRWIIQLQKMIKNVMESYEEKILNQKQNLLKNTQQKQAQAIFNQVPDVGRQISEKQFTQNIPKQEDYLNKETSNIQLAYKSSQLIIPKLSVSDIENEDNQLIQKINKELEQPQPSFQEISDKENQNKQPQSQIEKIERNQNNQLKEDALTSTLLLNEQKKESEIPFIQSQNPNEFEKNTKNQTLQLEVSQTNQNDKIEQLQKVSNKQKQLTSLEKEQQQLKSIQDLDNNEHESSEIPSMPFYML